MRTIIEREKRIKNTFVKMCSNCPKDIKAYGECVAKFMGEVEKDSCAKEFSLLMKCFRQSLRTIRNK